MYVKQCLQIGTTLFLGGLVATAQPAMAAVVSFQDGSSNSFVANYNGTQDIEIRQGLGTENTGARTILGVGAASGDVRNMLMRFDLTSMAGPTYQINSAMVTLRSNDMQNSAGTITMHRVAAANGSWAQGTGNYTSPTDGSSTWNFRNQTNWNPQTGTAWAGSQGSNTAGTDYVSSPISSLVLTGSESLYNYALNFPLNDLSVITDWINGSATNPGIILKSTSTINTLIWSSEQMGSDSSTDLRPQLTIDYTVVPEPMTGSVLALCGIAALGRRRMRVAE